MVTKEKKYNIPPKEYNELLRHITLADLYVTNIKSTLNSNSYSTPPTLEFTESCNLKKNDDNVVIIEVSYMLKAKSDKKKVFDISIKYDVIFTLSKKIPEEFFEIYNKYSLPLQTFPYFREYVNTILSRMGLPPLILPLRKNLIGNN